MRSFIAPALNFSSRLKREGVRVLALAVLGSAMMFVVACGGGGGGTSAALPGPTAGRTTQPTSTPTPTPVPTPTPTQTAASCSTLAFARLARTQVAVLRKAILPEHIGPGPSRQVCPRVGPGRARCMSWARTDVVHSLVPFGYGPSDLQSAYHLTSASSADGGAQIVAIVDAYDDPRAESDLGTYRSTFALSPCTTANGCFLKVNESGMTLPLPGTDSTGGWEGEESLDIDMASAICPNCKILLVEASSNFLSDFYTAEDTAVTCGAKAVSNSWDGDEYSGEQFDEPNFNHPGVMITVSSGDNGYDGSNSGYPAASQYVTAVGGTTLTDNAGSFSETVWPGTGSRCSLYIAQPSWQTALGSSYTNDCTNRIDNDVAAVADPNTGVAVYDSFGGPSGCGGWCVYGGTSAASPVIASVYALAGNEASLTYGSSSYSHTSSLFDITSGSNGTCSGTYLCTAGTGYDGPTGNGTPNGLGAF